MFAFDRARFFADFSARTRVALTPARRDSLDFLLGRLEGDAGFGMLRELAYVLATIHWETATTFAPVRERRASAERNPRLYALQQRYWPTGYYGRGYVQLTWDYNYRKAGQKLAGERFTIGGRLVSVTPTTFLQTPDYLLDPAVSYRIAARGMREGWFTGKRLAQFLSEGAAPDYHNARKIINGLDHAADIAALANAYELLLRGAQTSAPVAVAATAPVAPAGGAASLRRSRPAPISVEAPPSPTRRPAGKRPTSKRPSAKTIPAKPRRQRPSTRAPKRAPYRAPKRPR